MFRGFKRLITRVGGGERGSRAETDLSHPSALPDTLAAITLTELSGRSFQVVRSAEPNAYERGLMEGLDWGSSDVVWLVRKLLGQDGALIDVGANIGLVTIPVALDGTSVTAFEMLPANCLKLYLACRLNRLDRVRVIQAAVSSVDGLLTFGGEDAWGAVGTGNQVSCALQLDTAIGLGGLADVRATRRLIIKIDVEGHELEVLKGAATLIAARRPAIVFESIEFADGGDAQGSKQCKRFLENGTCQRL
jgi:FkbM family methyltransferase